MTSRRDVFVLLGAALAPRMLRAQAKQPVIIGWLNTDTRESSGHQLAAFRAALVVLGWKEGTFTIEERWADTRTARIQALAEELAAKKPAVIVTATTVPAVAATRAAPATPVVFIQAGDPIGSGLAASLARPGGMATGLTSVTPELTEKYLELLIAAVPTVKLRRVGFLGDSMSPILPSVKEGATRSATRFSVEPRFAAAGSLEEIEPAILRLIREGVQALVLVNTSRFLDQRKRIARLALDHRLPLVSGQREFTEAGALLSYGVDRSANFRRAAYYVDRILKGAKPGDLPIEQPTQFELVVNAKSARALGLTIPQPFLMRVDRVIE